MSTTARMMWASASLLAASHAALGASVDVGFFRITASGAPDISSQFRMTVSSVANDPGKVDFTFFNSAAIASSINQIYFADGSLLGTAALSQHGTGFVTGGTSLPGGATLDPVFTPTRRFRAGVGTYGDAGQATSSAGIDLASDSTTFRFALLDGATFDTVLDALALHPGSLKTLRVGIVADSIGGSGGRSDSFVSSLLAVPLPSAAWVGLAGLGLVAGAAWVRRRTHAAA